MLICPVCRSQNMETAKFCGNCGHPFPRQSEPVSTLVNCAQGHIYSAVYNHCPYCPQPQVVPIAPTVEEPVTTFDVPLNGARAAEAAEEKISYGDEAELIIRPEEGSAEVVEVPLVNRSGLPTSPGARVEGGSAPTIDPAVGVAAPAGLGSAGGRPAGGLSARLAGTVPPLERNRLTPPEPEPLRDVESRVGRGAQPAPPAAPPPRQAGSSQFEARGRVDGGAGEADRRTIVVADQVGAGRTSRGKIVGWLISFTTNPDGEDFRVYAGHNRVGANPVCDIVLNDDTVSGSHAILVYREGRCLIKDDLSRNGTFVNGREISEAHPLQNYDQIRLGNTYLTFVSAQRQ